MIHRHSTVAVDLATLEAARQRRATCAAELRALLDEEAASLARAQPAPSSPGLLTAWAERMVARDREARAAASPCPEIEARLRELAAVPSWEVEPESGPVSVRGAVVALGMWAKEDR